MFPGYQNGVAIPRQAIEDHRKLKSTSADSDISPPLHSGPLIISGEKLGQKIPR